MGKIVLDKVSAKLPTKFGEFRIFAFETADKLNHVALVKGDVSKENVLVRVHSECLTGDALHSLKCDCGQQLDAALSQISKEGGILLYLRQEGRGIGLFNKIKAYKLQEEGMDTVEANEKLGFKADQRDYTIGAALLKELGVKSISIMTNNPRKIHGLEDYGIKITGRVPLLMKPTKFDKKYLSTKKEKLGHIMEKEGVCK